MQNCTAVDEALRSRLGIENEGFVAQLLPQLMDLVRSSRRLPLGEEHAIRRGSREFLAASKDLGERSQNAAHRALRFLDPAAHQGKESSELANFNLVEDSIDSVLERVDACLRDALAGKEVSPDEVVGDNAGGGSELAGADAGRGANGRAGPTKPQLRWRTLVDNHRVEFVPRILVKHNARVPLPESIQEAQRRVGIRLGAPVAVAAVSDAEKHSPTESSEMLAHLGALGLGSSRVAKSTPSLPHPYAEELSELTWPEVFWRTKDPQAYPPIEDSSPVWVRDEEALCEMIAEIRSTCGGEIAVDVEHHDFRSYRGFVCLVQISTRSKDWLVDPFDMFEKMHLLNEIFSDSSILKVLHGADRDVMWLQRDFSVYIVNMFDTGLATRALRLQGGFGLANLVSHCCGLKLDKKYQTADWRQRPIPEEMEYYARCDTHFLLFCYDCVKNAVLAMTGTSTMAATVPRTGGLTATDEGVFALRSVMEKSQALCARHYSEAPLDAAATAMALCERFSFKQRPLETRQFAVLQALAKWRDGVARRLDESWNFVAPDHCLWRIALAMPPSTSRLRSTCNPLPAMLQQHAAEVVDLINTSKENIGSAHVSVPLASPAHRPAEPPSKFPTAAPIAPTAVAQTAEAPAQVVEWPKRSCGAPTPMLHLSSGGAKGGVAPDTLWALFDSESSDDEEIRGAVRGAAAARAAAAAAAAILQVDNDDYFDAGDVLAEADGYELLDAVPIATAGDHAEPDDTPLAAAPSALRDVYGMPGGGRRKKKAGRDAAQVGAAAVDLESEAKRLTSALVSNADPSLPEAAARPRKKKRKAAAIGSDHAAVTDPYALGEVADSVTVDPYALPGDLPAPPRKKKKKKARGAEQLSMDPYL